jgi:hypothetical protein
LRLAIDIIHTKKILIISDILIWKPDKRVANYLRLIRVSFIYKFQTHEEQDNYSKVLFILLVRYVKIFYNILINAIKIHDNDYNTWLGFRIIIRGITFDSRLDSWLRVKWQLKSMRESFNKMISFFTKWRPTRECRMFSNSSRQRWVAWLYCLIAIITSWMLQ